MARRRVGLILINIDSVYMSFIWPGAVAYAEDNDIDLVLLPGNQMNGKGQRDIQENHIYEFLSSGCFDGFVIASNVFGSTNTDESLSRFCQRFAPLPYVSLGTRLRGAPTIMIDNTAGLKDLIGHFADHHGFRHFGYIRGPEGHQEADERFAAFKSALSMRGISFDEDLLYVGDFNPPAGVKAASYFLARRQKVQAILAANDLMAIACLEELERNGVHVPQDIAVGGFDDINECKFISSPLSTVLQPHHKLSYTAMATLARLMNGEKGVEDVVLPTRAVIRRSCGCLPKAIRGMEEASSEANDSYQNDELSRLVLAFKGGDEELAELLRRFDNAMKTSKATLGDVELWNGYLNQLWLDLKRSGKADENMAVLFQKLRLIIGDFAERKQTAKRIAACQAAETLQGELRRIGSNFDIVSLKEDFRRSLRNLGVPTFALCLYTERYKRPEGDWVFPPKAKLALCEVDGRKSSDEETEFDPRILVPRRSLFEGRPGTFVITPLYYNNDHFGYMILKMGPREGPLYEALRAQLSGSYRAAYILADQKRQEEDLAAVDARLRELAKPMLEAIDSVAGIASARIDRLDRLLGNTAAAAAKLRAANDSAARVKENARDLNELISIIEDISVNINLLSINASIESARAGVHGKGFAVIASEIRKMATSTAENAGKASVTLSATHANIAESNAQSGGAVSAFATLNDEISELSGAFKDIADRMVNLERISQDMAGVLKR